MKIITFATLAFSVSATAVSAAQFYSSEAFFEAAISPTERHTDNFAALPVNQSIGNSYETTETNGFAWTLTLNTGRGLWSLGGGNVSTDFPSDAFLFTFTGRDVFAFGGNFWGTDSNGDALLADIVFQTSTGQSITQSASSSSNFIGIVSDAPMDWVSVSTSSPGSLNTWSTTTNVITAIPEPTTTALFLGMIAMGSVVWWRKRIRPVTSK